MQHVISEAELFLLQVGGLFVEHFVGIYGHGCKDGCILSLWEVVPILGFSATEEYACYVTEYPYSMLLFYFMLCCHFQLVLRSRIRGSVHSLSHTSSWYSA
jgi:hypothetical protein